MEQEVGFFWFFYKNILILIPNKKEVMAREYPIIRAYNGDVRQNIMLLFSKKDSISKFATFYRQMHIASNYKEYFHMSFIGDKPEWFTVNGLYDLRNNSLFRHFEDYAGENGINAMSFDLDGITYRLETTQADLDPPISV